MRSWTQLIKAAVFLIIFTGLIFLSWSGRWPHFVGFVAGLILLAKIIGWWRSMLSAVFDIPKHSFRVWLFAGFFTLINGSTFIGICLCLGKLDAFTGSLGFLVTGLLAAIFNIYPFVRSRSISIGVDTEIKEERALDKILVLVYLTLFCLGINLLWHSRTGAGILTPWQTIVPNYWLIYFFSTVILWRLIFAELSAKTALILITLHTFLTVSYLGFTHELFYGADIWRHIATENAIIQSGGWREILVRGTHPFFDWGKLSYAPFLSLMIFINQVFRFNLVLINQWVQPVLWSALFPILIFSLVREWGGDKKSALLTAALGVLPFALQTAGAFTLPVNFGFLVWIFFIWLLGKYARERLKIQLIFLLFFGSLLIIGYVLYFILFWLLFFIFLFLRATFQWPHYIRQLSRIFIFLITAAILPILEILFNFSAWPHFFSVIGSLKQLVGNFSGWFFVFGPRVHDIATGNILFNQPPITAFVPIFFTAQRFWLLAASVFFWFSGFGGMLMCLRKKDFRWVGLALLTLGLFAGYIISRYFLSGEHILARRLESVLAVLHLFFIIPFWTSVYVSRKYFFMRWRRFFIFLIIFCVSIVAVTSYSLGPDTKTVSVDEYRAAHYIWRDIAADHKHCVIADTYPLLALEAISAKMIIGGGFPIDVNFSQPERVNLWSASIAGRALDDVARNAKQITGATKCWFILPADTFFVINESPQVRLNFNNTLILSF